MITHPPKHPTKYFYHTDNYFEYEIGRVLEYFTKKMLEYGIEFDTYELNEKNLDSDDKFRPHHNIYPYTNDITYMYMDGKYGYEKDCYKLCFYPSHVLTYEQAQNITSLFCNHNDYELHDSNGNILNCKSWVEYLSFQASIGEKKEYYNQKQIIVHNDSDTEYLPLTGGTLMGIIGSRFIVQLRLNEIWGILRKEKIKNILK